MARALTYNEVGIAVVTDGVRGSDFADEFAFEVTVPDTLAEAIVGVDKATTSFYFDKTVEVKVAFKPTSPSNDQYLILYDNQQEGSGRTFNITIDTGVNERISLNRCAIKTFEGVRGGGKTTTMRVFTLTCEEFNRDTSA